jgi:hypothetical protein
MGAPLCRAHYFRRIELMTDFTTHHLTVAIDLLKELIVYTPRNLNHSPGYRDGIVEDALAHLSIVSEDLEAGESKRINKIFGIELDGESK